MTRLLSDAKNERLEEPPQQNKKHLLHKCLKKQCTAHGTFIVLASEEIGKPRSVEHCKLWRVIPGRTHIGPVLYTFVSKDQGSMCVEILVPTVSLMVETAWVRNWDVNHENLNQILKGWRSSL